MGRVNPVLRNILAVIAGVVIGSIVNMALIMISGKVIPPPAGVDVTTMEGLKAGMHLMEPKHFVFPFLAHALGTLVAAFLAAWLAASRRMAMALLVGVFSLAAGISAVMMLPAPMWFNVVDLVGAYLPMAALGGTLAVRRRAAA
jgi:hypothetical protein